MGRRCKGVQIVWAVVLSCGLLAGAVGLGGASPGHAVLRERIARFLRHECVRFAECGIKVVSLRSGETVIDHHGEAPFIPASNVKLITTAAALTVLRPEYSFRTVVYTDAPVVGVNLAGNVYVEGGGDPDLVSEQLWLLAKDIYNAGVRTIEGGIVADESFFDDDRYGPGWKAASTRAYNARVGALSLNFNTLRVLVEPAKEVGRPPRVTLDPDTGYMALVNRAVTTRKGTRCTIWADRMTRRGNETIVVGGQMPIGTECTEFRRTVAHPALYTVTVLQEMLGRMGIEVQGSPSVGLTPLGARQIAVHESRPLALIVWGLNKWSNNFVAEQLLKTMGAERYGAPGTFAKGEAVVTDFLSRIGVPEREYTIADGSGLSRLNRVSAGALVRVLVHMYHDFETSSEFVASLAVMGVDGSVDERLVGSIAEGRVRVKTGTLDRVSSLSGYAEGKDGEVFAFAILMNGSPCGQKQMRRIQDRIAILLVESEPGVEGQGQVGAGGS